MTTDSRVAILVLAGFAYLGSAVNPAWGVWSEGRAGNEPRGDESAPAEASDVVARVNGEPLYAEDVASVLGEIHSSASAQERSGFDLDQMLHRLVSDTLLAQEARTLGMDRDESIRAKIDRLRLDLAARKLEREEVYDRIEIDPDRLERVYGELFRRATVRIVTRRDKAEAEKLLDRIKEGADIESLAREQSQDPYGMRGGLMDRVARVDFSSSFGDVVFGMAPGELGGPLPTSHGWTIFRLEGFEPADPENYQDRRSEVLDTIRYRQREALRAKLLARLREKHEVQVDEAAYAAIGVDKLPDGRLVPKIEDPEAVVVEAGGQKISASSYGQGLAARWGGIANPEIALQIKPILLDSLIVDALIVAEGLDRGYHEDDDADREAHALETRLLVGKYLKEIVSSKTEPEADEIETYYVENQDEFRKPPLLFVAQISAASEAEAERLFRLLQEGADFGWLARRHSVDRYQDAGGTIGWVPANEGVRGFARELSNAEPGEIFGPKRLGDHWRLVRVGSVEAQGHFPFEQVSGNVRERVKNRKFMEVIDSLLETLRERSDIVMDEQALARLRIEATEDADQDGGSTAPGHGGGR